MRTNSSVGHPPTRLDIVTLADTLENEPPATILAWASGAYGRGLTLSTGFGPEGCLLVDLIGRSQLDIDIQTLDTGLLFPETYSLWRRLETRYGLVIRGVSPQLTVESQAALHGQALWARSPDLCCAIRKVEPLHAELAGFEAWITGIRRDQTPARAAARVVEWDERFGVLKINPLVGLRTADVWQHLREHDVPFNPLHERGYPSIGCMPCTSHVAEGEGARAGRWRGFGKTECGLHVSAVRPVAAESPA